MRTQKRSIAWLMWIILIAAVFLAFARRVDRTSWLARNSFFLLIAGFILALLWFVAVPKHSLKLARGNRDRQRRILRWIVGTPFGGDLKNLARFMLALNYQVTKQYDLAEAGYREVLGNRDGRLDPGFEAIVSLKLADTIEALGRSVEADEERKRTAASVENAAESFSAMDARGRMLDRQHRYPDAYAAYERTLVLAPPNQKSVYLALMMRLVLSSFNAGRPTDSLRWATATIDLDPEGPMSVKARRMAAVACANLGRLDDAERHVRKAIELASSANERAQSLALSSDYLMRRGDLDGAERVASEADALCSGKTRLPWIVKGTVAAKRGRLAEAIEVFEHARSINENFIPSTVRRTGAALLRDIAVLQAELGRTELALDLLRQAQPDFAGDGKLMVVFGASAAIVDALRNDRDAARARIAVVEEGRRDFPDDAATQRAVLYHLSRVLLLIGEAELAEAYLRAYLELNPDPVFRPYAFYHLAECRRNLGDIDGQRDFDTRAASTSFGTRWERLARERVASGGAPR